MRLPWSLGRIGRPAAAVSPEAVPPEAAPPEAAPAARPTGAWRELPAIQRTVEGMPLVAAPSAFVDRLPGSRGLPPIVEPLGHEVSPLATPGLIVAHARPVEAAPRSAIPAPVQRRARRWAAAEVASGAEPTAGIDEPADARPAAAPPIAVPEAPPVRSLSVVAREAVRVPGRPLTSAASVATVQRSRAAPGDQRSHALPDSLPSPGPAAAARPLVGMRRAAGGPGSRTPLTVSRSADRSETPGTPGAPPSSPAPAAGTSADERYRAGLGDPLVERPHGLRPAGRPTSAPVAMQAAPPPPVVQRSHSSAGQRRAASDPAPDGPRRVDGPAPGSPEATASSNVPLPSLPIVTAASRRVGAQRDAAPAAPEPPGTVIRPTVGRDPLRPRATVQRIAAADEPAEVPPDGAAAPVPWWQPADRGPAPGPFHGLTPTAGTHDGSDGPVSAGGSTRPGSAARPDPRSSWFAPSAPLPSGSVQRSAATRPSMPLSRASFGAGAAQGTTSTTTAPAPALPAIPAGSIVTAAPGPSVQRTPAAAPAASSIPDLAASAVVQRVEGAAPDPWAARSTSKPSEGELDELARAIFPRIRGRLRSELIYDREAKGLGFDGV